MFGSLLSNRSSEEHAQRRQNINEMKTDSGAGIGGLVGGFLNKPAEKK
jgi:hypothetical protein